MAPYSGTCCWIGADGKAEQNSPCRLEIGKEDLSLVPASGPPLSLDLGDIDEITSSDYELHARLYTGAVIQLSRFGKVYEDLCRDLVAAHRSRLVQCLLLNDIEQIDSFEAAVDPPAGEGTASIPAELRLYGSNLAILPRNQAAFQWRLAEIEAVSFDEGRYAVSIASGYGRLTITRLAKRTREFQERLQAAMSEVARNSAATVRSVFPFLTPEQFRLAADLLKEGRVASVASLAAIHARIPQALMERVVSARIRPCYDFLAALSGEDGPYAGFKLIRKEEPEAHDEAPEPAGEAAEQEPGMEADSEPSVSAAGKDETDVLHWFLFPLRPAGAAAAKAVAWETTSRAGRATYFFSLPADGAECALPDPRPGSTSVEPGVRRLNDALLTLNFRREPVYLSNDELALRPQYRRYVIACRKMPAVRSLRASFLGRAIHASRSGWQKQVEEILARL